MNRFPYLEDFTLNRKPSLLLFFAVAFGWSWLFWIPTALAARGLAFPPAIEMFLNSPYNPAAWGPLLAALVFTAREGGRAGVLRLLRRGVQARFGLAWYLVVLLLFPVLIGGSLLAAVLTGDPAPELPALAAPATLPIAFLYILLLGGPLQEEFGWRGVALEQLQRRWSALTSSLMIGLVWGAWHLPLFLMPRQEFYYQRPVWGLLLSTTLASVIFTWVYNNTQRSVFAVLLFHTMFNMSHYLFPTLGSDRASLFLFAGLFLTVAVVVAVWRPRTLTRPLPTVRDRVAGGKPV